MNLILCSDLEFPRGFLGRGGVRTHIYELSHALIELGRNVIIMTPASTPLAEWEKINKITIRHLPYLNLSTGVKMFSYSRTVSKEIHKLIDERRIDSALEKGN